MDILDCTLRDGGYYNNWDFGEEVVESYLEAMVAAGVGMIELGLRNYPSEGFKGAFYYTTDEYIDELEPPTGPEYGVMVDAKTFLGVRKTIKECVNELFNPKGLSQICFVRVACHFHEVARAREIVLELSDLGYKVFVNLMQITLRSDNEVLELSRSLGNWVELEGVYFADSLGNMTPLEVKRTIGLLRKHWKGGLGIHTHNNMGLAISNSLEAIDQGVSYIDATITGMGRGAGNAETEILMAELQARGFVKYKVAAVVGVVLKYFQPLRDILGWGPSLHYYMAARYNVHPTYVQRILTDNHFGLNEKIASIDFITELEGCTTFQESRLARLTGPSVDSREGMRKKNGRELSTINCDGCKAALLIGSGDGAKRHYKAVRRFVEKTNYKVFKINGDVEVIVDLIDTYIVSHNMRNVDYNSSLSKSSASIIAPVSRLSDLELLQLEGRDVVDYRVEVTRNNFLASKMGCEIPFDLASAYALAALITIGFEDIYLVGFDGYDDERQKEMSEVFHLMQKEYSDIKLTALTPTKYPVREESIYAPVL